VDAVLNDLFRGQGFIDGSTIWAITPYFVGPFGVDATHRGIVFSEVLMRVLAMLIRALFGRIPFILLVNRLHLMMQFVEKAFSLLGVLGFLVRSLEVVLRRVLLRMLLADVAPRRVAGVYGTAKIRPVAPLLVACLVATLQG
jgi:hypothetical protein